MNIRKNKRIIRVRSKIFGTAERPRLAVYISLKHLYAQLINDEKGLTLAAASDSEIKKVSGDIAKAVGLLLAKKALEKNITKAVFDRRGYKYHGKVKAIGDAVRAGGIKI